MPLSEKIKSCRTELHYTQSQLAEILGVSKRSVAYYESGLRCPTLSRIATLAKLFCVPAAYLIQDANTDRGNRYTEEAYRRELVYGTIR